MSYKMYHVSCTQRNKENTVLKNCFEIHCIHCLFHEWFSFLSFLLFLVFFSSYYFYGFFVIVVVWFFFFVYASALQSYVLQLYWFLIWSVADYFHRKESTILLYNCIKISALFHWKKTNLRMKYMYVKNVSLKFSDITTEFGSRILHTYLYNY